MSERDNGIFLVSADLPGCGSSTLVNEIAERVQQDGSSNPNIVRIGGAIRELLGISNEEELQGRLDEIDDPRVYDPPIYQGLPSDRISIIDGKLATTAGPQYIGPGRDITAIDLTGDPLVSAKRIVQRETPSMPFAQMILDPDKSKELLAKHALIKNRSGHEASLRAIVTPSGFSRVTRRHHIDTVNHSREEMVDMILPPDRDEETDGVPEWEIEALSRTEMDLDIARAAIGSRIHPADKDHFNFNFEGLKYQTERLNGMLLDVAIEAMRNDIRSTIADAWSSLMMKNSPRFFKDQEGNISLDDESQGWTPEYYKVAEAWPIFSTMLKDKSILDPFAGAGTLTNLLAAKNLPSKVLASDISYEGGSPLEQTEKFYAPDLNRKMWEILFDDLPSWYKPDHSKVQPAVAADARYLPFEDKSVDYVVADPPYGKNCPGGLDLLLEALPEMKRVAKEGSILLVPIDWLDELQARGQEVKQLTHDVSKGKSGLPSCYIHIASK